MVKNRIEWLLKGTNITFEMLEDEIKDQKDDKEGISLALIF